jgi:hypothetical protein
MFTVGQKVKLKREIWPCPDNHTPVRLAPGAVGRVTCTKTIEVAFDERSFEFREGHRMPISGPGNLVLFGTSPGNSPVSHYLEILE